jgi:hypothetical protein
LRTQAEWLAHFAGMDDAARARIAEIHRRIGEAIAAELYQPPIAVPLVVSPAVEVESDSGSAGRVVAVARACGWWAKRMEASGVDPIKGAIDTVTVRCGRHNERVWASWWNGQFHGGWYWTSERPGFEPLGWARVGGKRVKPLERRGVLDAIEGIRLSDTSVTAMTHGEQKSPL